MHSPEGRENETALQDSVPSRIGTVDLKADASPCITRNEHSTTRVRRSDEGTLAKKWGL